MAPWIAVLVSACIFGLAAAVGATAPGSLVGARLPLPEPGDVTAELLPSGEPVFVVRHLDGGASVLSAIGSHLGNLPVWCPSSRGFEEPGPQSRWDEFGHWMTGPAPVGLAPYEAVIDGDDVVVGARGDAPGRDVPPYAPWGPWCGATWEETEEGWLETVVGGTGHDLDALYAARRPGGRGRMERLEARLEVSDGAARLCAPRAEPGCGSRHWPVRSFFDRERPWPNPERCSGFTDGTVLARRVGTGFIDVALADGYAGVGAHFAMRPERDPLTCDWGTPEVLDDPVAGRLTTVQRDGSGWAAVLDDGRRFRLADPGWLLATDHAATAVEVAPGERLPQSHYRADQLPALLAQRGPLPVELWLLGDGAVSHLHILDRPRPGR